MQLRDRLLPEIKSEEDSLRFYFLDETAKGRIELRFTCPLFQRPSMPTTPPRSNCQQRNPRVEPESYASGNFISGVYYPV